mmetsp:Transcript_60590/g.161044  ORF Transcript_60590/g.161044 Transcript_60590/m.161044 type:complete len:141 (-) Transcript_60590:1688-2110(-)
MKNPEQGSAGSKSRKLFTNCLSLTKLARNRTNQGSKKITTHDPDSTKFFVCGVSDRQPLLQEELVAGLSAFSSDAPALPVQTATTTNWMIQRDMMSKSHMVALRQRPRKLLRTVRKEYGKNLIVKINQNTHNNQMTFAKR